MYRKSKKNWHSEDENQIQFGKGAGKKLFVQDLHKQLLA
jgi:hypothetical protein